MSHPRTGFATVHEFPSDRIVRLPLDARQPNAVTIAYGGESRVYDSPEAFLTDARESDPALLQLRADARAAVIRADELQAHAQTVLAHAAARAELRRDVAVLFMICALAGAAAALVVFGLRA